MRIAVIGTGYVGLVAGTCFAESGNDVVCIDNDAAKVRRLEAGEMPIYEPGLDGLVESNRRAGRHYRRARSCVRADCAERSDYAAERADALRPLGQLAGRLSGGGRCVGTGRGGRPQSAAQIPSLLSGAGSVTAGQGSLCCR